MNNCYFCSANAIFTVQILFLQYKCYFFGVHNKKNLSAQCKLLPPYGPVLINRAQCKSLLHFLGGGGVEVSLRTACCCQKLGSILDKTEMATFLPMIINIVIKIHYLESILNTF